MLSASDALPTLRNEVVLVPVGDEAVLYETDTGELHRLDAVARAACSLMDGVTAFDDLVTSLSASFDAPAAVVDPDLRVLIGQLRARGLLVGSACAEGGQEGEGDARGC